MKRHIAPTDGAVALRKAEQIHEETNNRWPEVRKQAETLRNENQINHFRESIIEAFSRRRA